MHAVIDTVPHKANSLTKGLFQILFFCCLFLVGFYAYRKPNYNWDILPYMAVVIGMDVNDSSAVHRITYNTARQQIPSNAYQQLTDTTHQYRTKMAHNAADFSQQLPFYIVKPLYTGLIYILYKTGFSLPASTVLPSVVAYILIGGLIFSWLKKYLRIFLAVPVGLLLMISPFMLVAVRTSSPDCLSAFFLLTAFYLIIEKAFIVPAFLFLLLSVFTRLDNVIPCFCVLSLLAVTDKWKKKISFGKYLLMLLILVVCCVVISYGATRYGWSILYYPSFSRSLNTFYSPHDEFSFKEYLALAYSQGVTGLLYSHIVIFMLLLILFFNDRLLFQFNKLTFEHLFLLTIVFIILLRFIMHPAVADRFYIPYYLVICILLFRKYSATGLLQKNNLHYTSPIG